MRRSILLAALALALCPNRGYAYVEAPMSLGAVIAQSSIICVMTVTKVDKTKNLIIYQKVADIKGKHPQDTIKHILNKELKPGEVKAIMDWAEPGKMAVFFHNGGASETCIGLNWYQSYAQGEWWDMSHGEPYLLRSFAGKAEKLPAIVKDIVDGKEVLAPCMVNNNLEDLHKKTARIQRVKASLKLQDYNPKRDFAGWGGEDIRRINGMPGFSQFAALARVDAEAQAISVVDFDGDGKLDLCLVSSSRVALAQNQGDSFSDVYLPGFTGGARSAVWADYNGDKLPDLLLATATGPKLFTNLGKGQFRDDSKLLPSENCYNLTAAAWIDADGDGQMDILLANGFHGLRLYHNKCPKDAAAKLAPPKLGDWMYIGPFDNTAGKGFDTAFPPESSLDLKKQYPGKNNEQAVWKQGNFPDGNINNLSLFRPENNADSTIYLMREIEVTAATELPISLGSDDTLTVWLNGEKLLTENVARACTPDQHKLMLKLKPGKNTLLLKVCQGTGDWAFYFAAGTATMSHGGWFEDVSPAWGLGPNLMAPKGDTLSVIDVNSDGKTDFLYGAGKGMLFVNTGKRFELKSDSGIDYQPGKVGPAFSDFDKDGHVDLFVPQPGGKCKLFRNDGAGKFTDVTDKSGDLAKLIPGAVSAAWGDFNNDGHLDLFVGCLRGINRYFENKGDGTFVEKTEAIGLTQRIFNSQAVALADINGDGKLDLIVNNEGQESAILFGNKEVVGKNTAVAVQLSADAVGARLRVIDKDGKALVSHEVSGGDGRGGQPALSPHFALPVGQYKMELRTTGGAIISKDVVVADAPLQVKFTEKQTAPVSGGGTQ
jgi:hypothetical protein